MEKITAAIKSFPSDKAAGPDGFGCEYYKRFSDIFVPLLLRMITNSKKDKALPKTLYEANIFLILKNGKEVTDPASYRPIVLQNFDRKIMTKILTNQLNKLLSSRFSFSNVRRPLNNMYINH